MAETCTAETVFATDTVFEELAVSAVLAVFCEVEVVAVEAVEAFVAKFAFLDHAVHAVFAFDEGASVHAVFCPCAYGHIAVFVGKAEVCVFAIFGSVVLEEGEMGDVAQDFCVLFEKWFCEIRFVAVVERVPFV